MSRDEKWLIGIDEAGRGPLAGPVAVGAVAVPLHFDFGLWDGVKDSKQLKETDREHWYVIAKQAQKAGVIRVACAMSSAAMIDQKGIVPAIRSALSRAVLALEVPPSDACVLLDGSLRAPDIFINQTTIIRGDASEPVIGLASIVAKVRRDRLMARLAADYPEYGFEIHKGYGTKKHRDAMREHGLSPIHRRSFCVQW